MGFTKFWVTPGLACQGDFLELLADQPEGQYKALAKHNL